MWGFCDTFWYLEFADDDDCGGYGGGVDRIDVLLYSMLFPYLDFSLSRFRGGGGKEGGRGLKKKKFIPEWNFSPFLLLLRHNQLFGKKWFEQNENWLYYYQYQLYSTPNFSMISKHLCYGVQIRKKKATPKPMRCSLIYSSRF